MQHRVSTCNQQALCDFYRQTNRPTESWGCTSGGVTCSAPKSKVKQTRQPALLLVIQVSQRRKQTLTRQSRYVGYMCTNAGSRHRYDSPVMCGTCVPTPKADIDTTIVLRVVRVYSDWKQTLINMTTCSVTCTSVVHVYPRGNHTLTWAVDLQYTRTQTGSKQWSKRRPVPQVDPIGS